MNKFITTLPKAELHVHLIGTLEPHLFLKIARRNNIKTIVSTVGQINELLKHFNSLKSFLQLYYQASNVMHTQQDFYDITYAYLKKVSQQGVLHAEIFFEAQSYMHRNVSFDTIINGISDAIKDAQQKYGITAAPILCFLRHLDEKEALATLQASLPFKDKIVAIGLASTEKDNPPSKFVTLFKKAREYGYKLCAHAGEDVGPIYIWQAIELLHVDRIDHGIRAIEDKKLITYLANNQLPLTVCPLSNLRLNIFNKKNYPLKTLLEHNLNISINSDDPSFFGGFISKNYLAAHQMGLTKEQLVQCARNSFIGSFASAERKAEMSNKLDLWLRYH